MKTFHEALKSWNWKQVNAIAGYWYQRIDDGNGNITEVCIEPLFFGQHHVAVYVNGVLWGDKVPVKQGYIKENEDDNQDGQGRQDQGADRTAARSQED